jgi:hypothetical protein
MMMLLAKAMFGILALTRGVVGQKAVGPVSSDYGYPVWYRDEDGTELELCLNDFQNPSNLCNFACVNAQDPLCKLPISFPTNWPGEAFWWMGEALIDNGAQTALLTMALEAAFASGEVPVAGDQIAFGRIRIRLDGFTANTDYVVTHPYGERIVTTDDVGSVFFTNDIGSLTTPADFSLALNSPVATSFLEWDTGAPTTHLGDPTVPHTVTGSPTDPAQNFFRVCPRATPIMGCIETNLFIVMGKRAVTSGVEVLRANFFNTTGELDEISTYLDVFAKSRPDQTLHVSGANIYSTLMKGDGLSDIFYAKVFVPGARPVQVKVTNVGDGTKTVAPVTDAVEITSVEYDVDPNSTGYHNLTVKASSSDNSAVLTASHGGQLIQIGTELVATVDLGGSNPPLDVIVTSSSGGSATKAVELVGPNFDTLPLVAVAVADPSIAAAGATVTLDGTGSLGDITAYSWVQTEGTPSVALINVTDGDQVVPGLKTFQVPDNATSGVLKFNLTVTGVSGTSTASVGVTVTALATPVAVARAPEFAIVGTTVTLDGSRSTGATSYQWSYTGEGGPIIQNADKAVASFTMPFQLSTSAEPHTFNLTVSNAISASSSATIVVKQTLDTITLTRVQLKVGKGELRVQGNVAIISERNEVSIYVGDGIQRSYDPSKIIGTVIIDPAATPMFDFRVNGLSLPNGTIDLVSSLGAFLDEVRPVAL